MSSCRIVTVTGHPAVPLPCRFSPRGLPVGVPIVHRLRDDFGVLQLAHALQQPTPSWKRRPAIAAPA